MSAERDVKRVLEQWLADGVDEMPERVYLTILDRVDRQPQRRGWRVSWRDSHVNISIKPMLAIAAVVVIAVLGLAILRPSNSGVGGQPAPQSPPWSPSPAPVRAIGTNLGAPGTILRAASFSEPFVFTVPAFPYDPSGAARVEKILGTLIFESGLWGGVTFHDDQSMQSDMCTPTGGRIADIPATPDAVGRWLGSSAGLVVSAPAQLTVDGRTALRWDVTTPSVCDQRANQPTAQFGGGERHRLYAVPTGTDDILVVTWGFDWSNGSDEYLDAVNAATDDLVRSMKFGG
jgi:hypothetical protein